MKTPLEMTVGSIVEADATSSLTYTQYVGITYTLNTKMCLHLFYKCWVSIHMTVFLCIVSSVKMFGLIGKTDFFSICNFCYLLLQNFLSEIKTMTSQILLKMLFSEV